MDPQVTSSLTKRSKGASAPTVPMARLSDGELVSLQQAAPPGDHRAFTELLGRHEERVHTNCRYLTSPEDADDLAQEVLVKAYFGLARFHGRSSFRTWLDRIKSNHCINHRQKARRMRGRLAPMEAAEGLADPSGEEAPLERISERRMIDETLLRMSPRLRIPLVLSDMDGFTLAEIAEALDIGLSAAKMRVMRGRKLFRELYDKREPGGPT